MQDCFCTETPVFCSASKQKGTRKISRPKAAGRNDEPLAVFQGNEQIIGLLAVQCIGLALNEIDLVHRQGKLTSHKSVDGVLLGVRLQAGHDRKLLGVQSLLDIFTDHGSREPDGQHELTGAAGEQGGSQIWLEPGEQFTLDEMLKAICVSSANDAAVAVAELVGGSEPAFVQQMNARAAELGMEHTTFCNACGLDTEGHLSTARDVAIMSRTILTTCPEVLHYTGIWTDTLRGGQTQLVNTNKLLRRYNGITGLKTGTTGGAGVCITASATRDGLNLIAVVLGAPSSKERFEAATTLLDYGFAAYRAAPVPLPQERPLQLKVKGSTEETVPLDYAALPATALLPAESAGQLTVQLELPETLEAPVTRGQTVGKAQLLCGEAVQGEYPVCAAADAPRMDFDTALQLLWDSLRGTAA